MKIAATAQYPASPEDVFAVLSDVAFQEAKCAATAAITYSAKVTPSGERTIITTERTLPSDGLPDFAKGMVGDTLKVVETQTWEAPGADGSRSGIVRMDVAGVPVALDGTMRLAPGGTGTVETIDTDLKARVPLVGGKIEKAAAPSIQNALDIEIRTAQEWLAR